MTRVRFALPLPTHERTPSARTAWPALAPRFAFVSEGQAYGPIPAAQRQVERRAARLRGQKVLNDLAALRQGGELPLWQVELAQAAALLTLARGDEAAALLATLQHNQALWVSLDRFAHRPGATLADAHWLWALAHVAIESAQGVRFLPVLWRLGLARRASLEPGLAGQLLVNCLQRNDEASLAVLTRLGVRLAPPQISRLQGHVARLHALAAQASRRQAPALRAELARLRQACVLLQIPTVAAQANPDVPDPQGGRFARLVARALPRQTQLMPPPPRPQAQSATSAR